MCRLSDQLLNKFHHVSEIKALCKIGHFKLTCQQDILKTMVFELGA